MEHRPILICSCSYTSVAPDTELYFKAVWKNIGEKPAIITKATFAKGRFETAHIDHYVERIKEGEPIRILNKTEIVIKGETYVSDPLVVHIDSLREGINLGAQQRSLDVAGIDGPWEGVAFVASIEYRSAVSGYGKPYRSESVFTVVPTGQGGHVINFPAGMTELT